MNRTDRRKPGGLDGKELITIESRKGDNSNDFFIFETTLQDVAALAGGYNDIIEIPTVELDTDLVLKPNGLGGVLWEASAAPGIFDVLSQNQTVTAYSTITNKSNPLGDDSTNIYLSDTYLALTSNDGGGQAGELSVTQFSVLMDKVGSCSFRIDSGNAAYLFGIPKGATEALALGGVSVDQLWVTQGHATLPNGVLMVGTGV
ncbi:MAG: hypothetical protein GY775_19320 [Candidatus Scalindua sp.]|nr:hypothetical protein [Candidatus Scalindua sp.]